MNNLAALFLRSGAFRRGDGFASAGRPGRSFRILDRRFALNGEMDQSVSVCLLSCNFPDTGENIVIAQMVSLMGEMFLLMFTGYIARRTGIITKDGKLCLTNLILYVILPCNIVKAFMNEKGTDWASMLQVLILASLIQLLCTAISFLCYNFLPPNLKAVYQYATVCSNAGFMGNPLSEAVFGDLGLLYTSIFLIPQRIIMWTAGVSYFVTGGSKKGLMKKVLIHPCMIAVYIGIFIMLSNLTLPTFLSSTITVISSCTTAMTMIYIGTILTETSLRTLVSKEQIYFAVLRLVLIPLAVYIPCRILHIDSMITGVCTFLTAMPAGSTTSLLATRYHADEISAARCVVFTTILSAVSVPVWGMLLTLS